LFQKFAKLEVLDVKSAPSRVHSASLSKFASYDDYRTDDGYVYVRVRAISSRVNKNHDGWPSTELAKSYRTFVGKPIFVDHHNTDPTKARGVIVDAALHVEDAKTSKLDPYYASAPENHLPPTWIELLLEVDATKYPKLAKAVINGDIDGVSMGANVELSKCSHCGHEARSPEQYCQHVSSKGAYFDYYDDFGNKTSKKSYEDCYDIGFFEISFVFDPADETALVSDIKHTARLERIAAIRKEADFANQFSPVPGREEPQYSELSGGPGPQAAQAFKQLRLQGVDTQVAFQQVADQFYGGDVATAQQDVGRNVQLTGSAVTSEYKYVKKQGDKWVITQKGTGKVLSTHDSEEQAKSAFRAMEMHMHGKTADTTQVPQSDMTKAPNSVDTLRQEQVCPICGSDMEDGVCEVCNFEEPPEGFGNPDLDKAKQVDEQMHQQDAEQAQQGQGQQPSDVTPGPAQAPPPLPGGAMPGSPSGAPTISSTGSGTVTSEQKTSAAPSGRINTQERPILPVTRKLTDKPVATRKIKEATKPVQSNTKENMTQTQKTADGATALGEGVQAEKRVDVTGVGAVSGDPLSGIEHANLETDTGDFTAPHTDTWTGNEGDSLGQQDAVTSEAFEGAPGRGDAASGALESPPGKASKTADTSDDLGGPIGDGVGDGGNAKTGIPTWDTSDAGIPDHDPARIDLNAPLKEEVGGPTKTDSTEEFRSLKLTEPVTSESANEVGGPIGTAIASAKARQFKAFQVAEAEIDLGLAEKDSKFERVAELENTTEEALDAQIETLSKVKTAGLRKNASVEKTAGLSRMPSFSKSASFDIEAHSVSDYATEDVIGW
jgi:hypothetical protein